MTKTQTPTGTVAYVGACRCGRGHRVEFPEFETVQHIPDERIAEVNKLQDAGEIVGFDERMAWLRQWRVDVLERTDRHATRSVECVCGKSAAVRLLKARHSEKECGGACRSAKGPSCECKCDGANHGAGWM